MHFSLLSLIVVQIQKMWLQNSMYQSSPLLQALLLSGDREQQTLTD